MIATCLPTVDNFAKLGGRWPGCFRDSCGGNCCTAAPARDARGAFPCLVKGFHVVAFDVTESSVPVDLPEVQLAYLAGKPRRHATGRCVPSVVESPDCHGLCMEAQQYRPSNMLCPRQRKAFEK